MQKPLTQLKGQNLRHRYQQRKSPEKLTSKREGQTLTPKSRLFMIWGILIITSLGLGVNLYRLQILDGEKLTQKARNQQMVTLKSRLPRRLVVDRNQEVLAIDRPVYTLYAHPKLFTKSQETIATPLASILDKTPGELVKTFQRQKSGILLASGLPQVSADRIKSLRFNGLELITKQSRFYPTNDLMADILGYVNLDRKGQAGVEFSQEELLKPSVRSFELSRAGNGELLPNDVPQGFLNSDNLRLQLTMDSRLQRASRAALNAQMQKFEAKRGAVIVMDAWDGSLLALVCYPTYNPNEYSKADISLFKNWTVADLYEPGSTFKPLNIAIALETGVIKPNDMFNDTGAIQVGRHTIRNAELNSHGLIDIAQILQTSSNIGMVEIIQRLHPSPYYNWLERLGLGQTLHTDLPFAVGSQMKSQKEFISSPIEAATTSFGQGFSLTPLHLIQMHGSLANGGKLVVPHVVKGLVDAEDHVHYSPHRPKLRQIFSPGTTETVVKMMETVVSEGTGKSAAINGYRIAGKTGTAQKASPEGGYIPNARITSFISILPVESPRYVVLVIADEPKGSHAYGSTVAAPVAKKVMEALILIEGIPPSQSR